MIRKWIVESLLRHLVTGKGKRLSDVSTRSTKLAAEIRAELRSILRQRDELHKPLDSFGLIKSRPEGGPRYYVLFDHNYRRLAVQGYVWAAVAN